jgi:hypothetical protein
MVKRDFPYSYPQYLSPVLQILSDGETHSTEEIRTRILADFPLTPDELGLKCLKDPVTIFVNKAAFAFRRFVIQKAIEKDTPRAAPGAFRPQRRFEKHAQSGRSIDRPAVFGGRVCAPRKCGTFPGWRAGSFGQETSSLTRRSSRPFQQFKLAVASEP